MKRFIAATLLLTAGCRTTMYTAVVSPRGDTCVLECPRTGSEESYLNCLRSCPEARVREDQECVDTKLVQGQVCSEQMGTKFSIAKTVVLAVLSILVVGAVAAAAN